MKQKILFIISNMESGGVSKSMLSLLHTIDKIKYDVDLLVVNPTGIFMPQLPQGITLLTDEKAALFFAGFPANIPQLVKKGYWFAALSRIAVALLSRLNRAWSGILMSKFLPVLPAAYDLAVDYNGQQQLYYLIDKINAVKKVTFFHNDYTKYPYYYSMDKIYYPKADRIFSVSPGCVQSLKNTFPQVADKVNLFENISPLSTVLRMANEEVAEDLSPPALLTVGHLCERKGTSLALQAAKLLREHGVIFRWFFIGADTGEKEYRKMVEDYGLERHVFFLGLRSNPYPYMSAAAVVVHPSEFEGKSIALDEAKILAKPVVVTNFSTVGDQFTHRYNATITEMDAEEIADAIAELLTDTELSAKYVFNLTKDRADNSDEVNKLYRLLE